MREYALVLLVAAAVTFLLTPAVRRVAVRTKAIHEPRARDTHTKATPLLGGLAMYGGLVAGLVLASRLSFVQDPFHAVGSRTEAGLLLSSRAAFDPDVLGGYPHNVPAETLGEEGAIGFVIYLAINWMALKGLREGLRLTRADDSLRRLLAVAGANYIFTLLTTLKEGNMVGSAEFFMSAIILARLPEMIALMRQPASVPEVEAAPAMAFANLMR